MLAKTVRVALCFTLFVFFLFPSLLSSQETILSSEEQTYVLSQADSILKQLSATRALTVKHPLEKFFKSKEQLYELLSRYSSETKHRERLEAERKTMLKFGLIPKDFPYVRFALDLLTEQIAGFYDFRTHSLNLLLTTPVEMQIPILTHELMHALQDQNFELKQFMEPIATNDDLSLAHQALVEGEATALMLDFLLKPAGQSLSSVNLDVKQLIEQMNQSGTMEMKTFRAAPRALQTTLTAPYLYGTSFFQYFRLHNSWPRATALYQDPPRSMEQLMHPEKYFERRDPPIDVSIPSLPPKLLKRWKRVEANVLGELGCLVVLQQFLNDNNAKIASEGWGGDQYDLYENEKGQRLLLLFTTWDTPEDANQFINSYRVVLQKKYSPLKLISSQEQRQLRWSSEEGQIGLELRGTDVALIEGSEESEFEALRELLWQTRKDRSPSPKIESRTP